MKPISYVEALRVHYGALGFPPYEWTVNDSAPFTALKKPLAACNVSILTTGGISRLDEQPFNADARNDLRLDAISSDTPADYFQVHDNYYDHRSVKSDVNCQFPIERVAELARDGFIGRVAPRLWSGFMGRIYTRSLVVNEAAPAFADKLHDDQVDVLIVIPACPLDHQTAGLVARVVEESGIVTVTVSTGRDISWNVRPPRTVFVNFPMGNALGKPGDIAQQRLILEEALNLAAKASEPGVLIDLPYEWPQPFSADFPESSREYQLKK